MWMLPLHFSFVCLMAVLALPGVYCPNPSRSRSDPDVTAYLNRYGYLRDSRRTSQTAVRRAINDFQGFVGLPQTGVVDESTKNVMNMKRCGNKDITGRRVNQAQSGLRIRYMTYKITKYPTGLRKCEVDATVAKAFEVWEDVAPLSIRVDNFGKTDIEIRFESHEHEDEKPFDGPGGSVAHAMLPVNGGGVHFDSSETWTINSDFGTNLFQVAAHEFGHALGLLHLDDPSSVMFPIYKGYKENFELSPADIRAIHSRYYDPATKPYVSKRDFPDDQNFVCDDRVEVTTTDDSKDTFSSQVSDDEDRRIRGSCSELLNDTADEDIVLSAYEVDNRPALYRDTLSGRYRDRLPANGLNCADGPYPAIFIEEKYKGQISEGANFIQVTADRHKQFVEWCKALEQPSPGHGIDDFELTSEDIEAMKNMVVVSSSNCAEGRGIINDDLPQVEAVAGGNVALPCSFNAGEDFQSITGYWKKHGLRPTLYTFSAFNSRSDEGIHNPIADDRLVSRLRFDILARSPVLLIKDVLTSDEGTYECEFYIDGRLYNQTTKLIVKDAHPPICSCPNGDFHFLPCDEIFNITETCLRLKEGNATCSAAVFDDVSIDVLSCGGSNVYNTTCIQDGRVPMMTVVHADCWGAHQGSYRCHSDGRWREFGKKSRGNLPQDGAMGTLCMPLHINSELCGHNYNGRWPFIVGLKKRRTFSCKGTLINPYFVVTAAHCITRSQEQFYPAVEAKVLTVQWNEDETLNHEVEKVFLHPSYIGAQNEHNDIALIKMKNPLVFGKTMNPACVHLEEDPLAIASAAVAFARSERSRKGEFLFSAIRQKVDPPCQNYGQRCSVLLNITNTQICTLPMYDETQVERGDSGGPILQDKHGNLKQRWGISGVVSSRKTVSSCRESFTIFTKVASFRDWITKTVNGESV